MAPHSLCAAGSVQLWFSRRQDVFSSNAFCRAVLSRYAAAPHGGWSFETGPQGKPRLVNAPIPLDFNLSHSGEWLACAVTAGEPVGMDMEDTAAQRDVMRLARRFFSAGEIADLGGLPEAASRDRFFDYWTLKEAAVKAVGGALAPALSTLAFELRSSAASAYRSIHVCHAMADDLAMYCLLQLPGALAAYRLALCWYSKPGAEMEVSACTLQADGQEAALPLALRAASGPITLSREPQRAARHAY